MERLAAKYADVDFVFIYCHEAHPANEENSTAARPVLRAHNFAERRGVALWMRAELHLQRLVLPDEFGQGSVFDRYFSTRLDNPLVIVDTDGKVACAMSWTAAEQVDLFLGRLLAHGGKWDATLKSPQTEPNQNSSPNFKAMYQRLQHSGKK